MSDERDPAAAVVADLAKGHQWATFLVGKLVNMGEYDILNHLYKKGPKGADLWWLYKHHCFSDWDLFFADLKMRLETDE